MRSNACAVKNFLIFRFLESFQLKIGLLDLNITSYQLPNFFRSFWSLHISLDHSDLFYISLDHSDLFYISSDHSDLFKFLWSFWSLLFFRSFWSLLYFFRSFRSLHILPIILISSYFLLIILIPPAFYLISDFFCISSNTASHHISSVSSFDFAPEGAGWLHHWI